MTRTEWNQKLKIAALNGTLFVVVLALAAPFFVLGAHTSNVLLVLLAAASYALAAYGLGHLRRLAGRALRGPTGYVCRHCGADMTVKLCAVGHTHELVAVDRRGGAA